MTNDSYWDNYIELSHPLLSDTALQVEAATLPHRPVYSILPYIFLRQFMQYAWNLTFSQGLSLVWNIFAVGICFEKIDGDSDKLRFSNNLLAS